MNLLFVTPFFSPQTGGVATYLEDARRALSLRGHEVYVLRTGEARDIRPCPLNNDGRVYEFYLRGPWAPHAPVRSVAGFVLYFVPTVVKLARFIRQKRIQLVSVEYPLGFALYFTLLRALTGVRLVVGLHGDDVLSLEKLVAPEQAVVKHAIRRADWVLSHSASLMGHAQRIVGGLSDRRSYLPYGIDCEMLRRRADRSPSPTNLAGGSYILTVAKLYDRKGIDVLLRAIPKVRASLRGMRFLIVGDGPEEATLRRQAVELGISDCVVFAGDIPLPKVPPLFRDCSFFVLPSRSEPFGIVLLEAMTFGRAILATRVGGIPEFVTDGFNGLLVPSEDSGALAEKIDLLIRDPDLRSQIAANAAATVEAKYDYRILVSQYEHLFTSVLQRAG